MSTLRESIYCLLITDQVGFGVTLDGAGRVVSVDGPTIGITSVDPNGTVTKNDGALLLGRGAATGIWRNLGGGTTWQRLNPAALPSGLPVPVAEGGTGANNAVGARTNLSAETAGAAVAAVAAHLLAFNHGLIPSALPVPLAEGGTGAVTAPAGLAALGGLSSAVSTMWVGSGTVRNVNEYNILTTDVVPHDIDTTAGAVELNLPAVAAWVAANPNMPFIRIGWVAGANPATIDPNGAEQINAAGAGVAFTLVTVGDSVDLYPVVGGWRIR